MRGSGLGGSLLRPSGYAGQAGSGFKGSARLPAKETAGLIEKEIFKKRMSNIESSSGGQVLKDCILSILYIKKSIAKPPARRDCSAYASASGP